MLLVNYGRQAIYHRAGNVVECRYCVHFGTAPSPTEPDRIYCPETGTHPDRMGRCNAFRREPGADDA
jgi:hypothetical protein